MSKRVHRVTAYFITQDVHILTFWRDLGINAVLDFFCAGMREDPTGERFPVEITIRALPRKKGKVKR